jgi:uncharacterized protein (DUF427 family)
MSPEHFITIDLSDVQVRVFANDEMVAQSARALRVLETGHDPVLYLPPEDVRLDIFQKTSHSTHCPYKGDASYWTITAGGEQIENAAWSYEYPIEQATQLKGYIAFYSDKVDLQTG